MDIDKLESNLSDLKDCYKFLPAVDLDLIIIRDYLKDQTDDPDDPITYHLMTIG
ncbi:hypothetical protein [Mucilaginibacter sp. UYCu711]|uniref:hypothetical protein n=1 Tax=Mucilaginibacter sp. UYCu711 TaxID=3156339 RepID=UPI003D1D97CA